MWIYRNKSRLVMLVSAIFLLAATLPVRALDTSVRTDAQATREAAIDKELDRDLDSLSRVELKGEVSVNVSNDKIAKTIQSLIDAAVLKDEEMDRLDQAYTHHHKKRERVVAWAASALNYGILTRGDMPSSEAGDVILNEKIKLKSKGSTEFAKQRQIDQTQLKVVSSVMEIAMGLGTVDQSRSHQLVSDGTASLSKLVGEADAEKAIDELRRCSESLQVPDSLYLQAPWGVQEQQERTNAVLQAAIDNDQVMSQIKKIVHKYNHHSKLYRVSSRVMNVSLSIAGLSPTLVGPAAQVALLAYIMATGGPEEDKLMSELYLDKRLESRFGVLKDKTELALNKYEIAQLTKNPMLLVTSQALIKQMTCDDLISRVFSKDFAIASAKKRADLAHAGQATDSAGTSSASAAGLTAGKTMPEPAPLSGAAAALDRAGGTDAGAKAADSGAVDTSAAAAAAGAPEAGSSENRN